MKIRKARKGDGKGIADFIKVGFKKDFYEYTGNERPYTKEEVKDLDKRLGKKTKDWFIVVATDDSGKIIGSATFSGGSGRMKHRGLWGCGIHPDHTKKGVATSMLKYLIKEAKKRGYRRLEAEVAVTNKPSLKLIKKVGFKIEGRKSKGMQLEKGKYLDTYFVGKVL